MDLWIGLMFLVVGSTAVPFRFVDVTSQVGILATPHDKVSGSSIADLNQDGYLDIIQSNHGQSPADAYYGNARGTFRHQERFLAQGDRHGTCVGDVDDNGMPDAFLSIGLITNPSNLPHVRVELTNLDGSVRVPTPNETGFTQTTGYLFGCRLMDMDGDGDLDLLGQGGLFENVQNHVYENTGGGVYQELSVAPINRVKFSPFALGYLVTDFNGDGYLDIVLYGKQIKIFKGGPRFQYTDVTTQVLPSEYSNQRFSAAAQIDIDNDGDFDLYFTGGQRLKARGSPGADLLLENQQGIFRDISSPAGIPRTGGRNGVSVADFDNDGYLDLFVGSAVSQPVVSNGTRLLDILLRNNGNKTFTAFTNHGAKELSRSSDRNYPAGLQAFDFNRDGLVDILIATRYNDGVTGAPGQISGKLQLFKNTKKNTNRWFVVKVPVNIRGRSTMDALVKLKTPSGWLYRRVGSVGEGRSHSFIDQVHFGLGLSKTVSNVVVEVIGGSVRIVNDLRGVAVNQIYALRV
uniref:ASPIC/UnbV domain-containing protein n=1 Tax=Compsopogon caeruleus TaxID=31354 RepID=A0A7S1XE62_9RHOD|mmetsp:Transcript_4420/g.8722  ORF Transcript_4420/g.8722 Transcript_4420/m.8722 type:complete len:517 (+) Transcript_4420:500-2050(+)